MYPSRSIVLGLYLKIRRSQIIILFANFFLFYEFCLVFQYSIVFHSFSELFQHDIFTKV